MNIPSPVLLGVRMTLVGVVLTVFALTALSVAKAQTPPQINLSVGESIGFGEVPVVAGPSVLSQSETISATETVQVEPPGTVTTTESIALTDSTIIFGLPLAETELVAGDASDFAAFGTSVAISDAGDVLAIGAQVDGASFTGAVYVFEKVGEAWSQTAKLTASDAAQFDRLGLVIAISGDGSTIVAGAPSEDAAGDTAGAVYIFERSGGGWATTTEDTKLTAGATAGPNDEFGRAVSVDGDTILVGAPFEDDAFLNQGAVYVFLRTGSWALQQRLVASDPGFGEEFGFSVSLQFDTAAIGASRDDDIADNAGAAYIFERAGVLWSQKAKLTASDAAAGDEFGQALSIDNDSLVVGALLDDDGGADSGSAYVFQKSGGVWVDATEDVKLVAVDAAAGDEFGASVALDATRIAVGTPFDDEAQDAGSVAVFIGAGADWTQYYRLTAGDGGVNDALGGSVAIADETVVGGAAGSDEGATDGGEVYVFNLQTNSPLQHTLDVSVTGDGTGAITSQPVGIDCGATCSADFDAGTVVTLTATPATGSSFGGWSGACSGSGACSITMNQPESVGATFDAVPVVAVPGLTGPGLVAIAALFAALLVWRSREGASSHSGPVRDSEPVFR